MDKMDKKARIVVHPDFCIGPISPRLYGAFLEPIGTMVNGSMFNPKHPTADDKGFRRDFIAAVNASGLPAIRLPGGNFVSGWDWKDSIGPADARKTRLDPAWKQYIPNDVGHDEYLTWSERAAVEPLYTLNLGTGGINDAMKLVEYTNHPGGSYWSDLRRQNGHDAPYDVKTWYLGNEMDGPWQIGSWLFNPQGYGSLANEVSKVMKMIDPRIETVVCGSTSFTMPHYPQWDLDVLTRCYASVDYISLHYYHSAPPEDYAALLGGSGYFEDYINSIIALCDFVQAQYRSPKKLMLSFDEYGTMPHPPEPLNPGRGLHGFLAPHYTFGNKTEDAAPDATPFNTRSAFVRHDPDQMPERPFPGGDMLFALTSASAMLTFLRHADRVKIGCMTGGLRALAATDRNHVWKPAAYYPFTQLMQYGRGVSLQTKVEGDTYDLPGYAMNDSAQFYTQKGLSYIETAAAYDRVCGTLNLFVLNRDWEAAHEVTINIGAFAGYKFIEHLQLYSADMDAKNTYESPDTIRPTVNSETRCKDGICIARVEKLSWNVLRFGL